MAIYGGNIPKNFNAKDDAFILGRMEERLKAVKGLPKTAADINTTSELISAIDARVDTINGERTGLNMRNINTLFKVDDHKKKGIFGGFGKGKYHPDNVFVHDSDGYIIFSKGSNGIRYFRTNLKEIKDKVFYLRDTEDDSIYFNLFKNNTYTNIIAYYNWVASYHKAILMGCFTNLFNKYADEIPNLDDISMKEIGNRFYEYMYEEYFGDMEYIKELGRPLVFYDFVFDGEKMGLACCQPRGLYKKYIYMAIAIDPISNRLYTLSFMIKNK